MNPLNIVFYIAILATAYAVFNFYKVKHLEEGTTQMSEIALSLRNGANTFLFNEYKILVLVVFGND